MASIFRARVVSNLRKLHEDEAGEGVVGSIAIGAVGVLLAALVFSTMSSVMQSSGQGMFSGMFSGITSKFGSLLGR